LLSTSSGSSAFFFFPCRSSDEDGEGQLDELVVREAVSSLDWGAVASSIGGLLKKIHKVDGGLKHFLCLSLLGGMIQFDQCFF